jgi:hypothetical protein
MLGEAGSKDFWLRCKDNFEARKIVGSIPLCSDLKEAQDELRLFLSIITT